MGLNKDFALVWHSIEKRPGPTAYSVDRGEPQRAERRKAYEKNAQCVSVGEDYSRFYGGSEQTVVGERGKRGSYGYPQCHSRAA